MLVGVIHVLAPNEIAIIAGAGLVIAGSAYRFIKGIQGKVEGKFKKSKDLLLDKIKFIQQNEGDLGRIKNQENLLAEYETEKEKFSKNIVLLKKFYNYPLVLIVLSWLSLTIFNIYYVFLPEDERGEASLILKEILCMGESKLYCSLFMLLLLIMVLIYPFLRRRWILKKRQNVGNKINKYIADAVINISVSGKEVENERQKMRRPPTDENPLD